MALGARHPDAEEELGRVLGQPLGILGDPVVAKEAGRRLLNVLPLAEINSRTTASNGVLRATWSRIQRWNA